jgi:RNA polymerase sigma-70 factor, ECF subfamily
MRIHRSRHTYRPGDPLLPWVFAIARHTKLDSYRRTRFRLTKEQLVSTAPEPPQHGAAVPETKYPEVLTLLEKLPESQRELLLMLKVSGRTVEEVARATSSTAGAIKQKAHRAYVSCVNCLKRREHARRDPVHRGSEPTDSRQH